MFATEYHRSAAATRQVGYAENLVTTHQGEAAMTSARALPVIVAPDGLGNDDLKARAGAVMMPPGECDVDSGSTRPTTSTSHADRVPKRDGVALGSPNRRGYSRLAHAMDRLRAASRYWAPQRAGSHWGAPDSRRGGTMGEKGRKGTRDRARGSQRTRSRWGDPPHAQERVDKGLGVPNAEHGVGGPFLPV
jgi:hypothetical protein